jgi:hypothetical protein
VLFVGVARNLTIVLEEKVADWARAEAAKRRTSVSSGISVKCSTQMMGQEETY